jgi:hypothetical protein
MLSGNVLVLYGRLVKQEQDLSGALVTHGRASSPSSGSLMMLTPAPVGCATCSRPVAFTLPATLLRTLPVLSLCIPRVAPRVFEEASDGG